MRKPYTYLIGWIEHDVFYYGGRWRKGCHPEDLWVKYFTSSRVVKEKRAEWGEPTLVMVRRTFDTAEQAKHWENRVLRRLHVRTNPRFLNLTEIPGPPHEKTKEQIEKIAVKNQGKKRTPEQAAKCGPKSGGWKLSEETRAKMSTAAKGKKKPDGFAQKMREQMTGRLQTQEEREKRKKSLTGKKKSPEHIKAVVEAKKRNALARKAKEDLSVLSSG